MFAPRYFAPRFFAPRYFPPGAEVVEVPEVPEIGPGGTATDERRNVIIDGIRYRVNRFEEIQLLQAWIDRLNDEQKAAQVEVKKERKQLRTLKAKPIKKKGKVKKETTRMRVIRRNIDALLLTAKALEQKRSELIDRRQNLQDRLDEEDIIAIVMSRRLF